jgi:hypothetical protein
VELHVGCVHQSLGYRLHELGDVLGREMALQRVLALPHLDEDELVRAFAVLIEPVARAARFRSRSLSDSLAHGDQPAPALGIRLDAPDHHDHRRIVSDHVPTLF